MIESDADVDVSGRRNRRKEVQQYSSYPSN